MTANIYHKHLYGTRESKFAWLNDHDVLSTDFVSLDPQSPFYLFIPQNTDFLDEYRQFWKITDIMPVSSVGVVTARDSLTINFSKDDVWQTINAFINLSSEEARIKYDLGKDARDWKVEFAQKDLRNSGFSKDLIQPILYRPFDIRYTYYTGNSRGFHCMPRQEVMRNMIADENLGLIFMRQAALHEVYSHFMVTRYIVDNRSFYSNKGIMSISPLYIYPKPDELLKEKCCVNFSEAFLSEAKQKLGNFTPEDMFAYIYAIFHSPTYRSRYAEFLKMDFPRVPLTSDRRVFDSLSELGKELIAVHLLEKPLPVKTKFPIAGTNEVGVVKYDSGKVWINKTQYIHIVDENIWQFHIGGYQVCQKWLKDRKGRKLGYDDLLHYGKMVAAIGETIRIMAEIETVFESGILETC